MTPDIAKICQDAWALKDTIALASGSIFGLFVGWAFYFLASNDLKNTLVELSSQNARLRQDLDTVHAKNYELRQHLDEVQKQVVKLPDSIKYTTRIDAAFTIISAIASIAQMSKALPSVKGVPKIAPRAAPIAATDGGREHHTTSSQRPAPEPSTSPKPYLSSGGGGPEKG